MTGPELDLLENRSRNTSTVCVPGHGVIVCAHQELTNAMIQEIMAVEIPKIHERKEFW